MMNSLNPPFKAPLVKLVRVKILINGTPRGTKLLPYTLTIREMGETKVEVIPEDEDAWIYDSHKTVQIKSGGKAVATFAMKPSQAQFIFQVEPSDADIYVLKSGLLTKKITVENNLYVTEPGTEVKIMIRKKGYQSFTKTYLAISGKKEIKLNLNSNK